MGDVSKKRSDLPDWCYRIIGLFAGVAVGWDPFENDRSNFVSRALIVLLAVILTESWLRLRGRRLGEIFQPGRGGQHWFGVRSVVAFDGLYEERVVILRASSFEDALSKAESEVRDYCANSNGVHTNLLQAFQMSSESLTEDSEVFSLTRRSDLGSSDYLNMFFNTGDEVGS